MNLPVNSLLHMVPVSSVKSIMISECLCFVVVHCPHHHNFFPALSIGTMNKASSRALSDSRQPWKMGHKKPARLPVLHDVLFRMESFHMQSVYILILTEELCWSNYVFTHFPPLSFSSRELIKARHMAHFHGSPFSEDDEWLPPVLFTLVQWQACNVSCDEQRTSSSQPERYFLHLVNKGGNNINRMIAFFILVSYWQNFHLANGTWTLCFKPPEEITIAEGLSPASR